MNLYEVFRGKVAAEKQIRRLTYKDIAKMCGVSENAIAQFMCGTRVSDAMARKISKALDIEL